MMIDGAKGRGEGEDWAEAEPTGKVPLNRATLRGERGLDMPDRLVSTK